MPSSPLVIEFHYKNGDVGAYPLAHEEGRKLWAQFCAPVTDEPDDTPSHIVIRQQSDESQKLSNDLFAAARDFWNSRFPAVLRRKS